MEQQILVYLAISNLLINTCLVKSANPNAPMAGSHHMLNQIMYVKDVKAVQHAQEQLQNVRLAHLTNCSVFTMTIATTLAH